MTTRTLLRRIHLIATIWFTLCVAYLLGLALRQAGFRWWVVFSLSGYSATMIALLVSLYLFALFHGVDGARHIGIEHPLTCSYCYLGFYVSAPLLGGLAALAGTAGSHDAGRFLFNIAMGTLGTTFVVWIVIDPALAMIETLLPTSRRNRAERIERGASAHLLRHS